MSLGARSRRVEPCPAARWDPTRHRQEHPKCSDSSSNERSPASELTTAQLAEISKTSNEAVASLGVPYTWVNSFAAGDKVYCVHEAEDAETIREHARRGGFPANLVTVVANEFGPHTADQAVG